MRGDTLTVLERQILEFEGIDPDTLPTLAEVLVSGRMAGELTVNGSFENLSVTGRAAVDEAFYVGNSVGQAEVSFSAVGLLSQEREVSAQIDADAISVFEREFDSVSVNLFYREPSGNVSVFLVRSPEESYSGRLALDEEGDLRTLNLDELVFRFPEERWNLGGPATISWDPDGLTFSDFRMRRPGVGGMRLQAQGRIPFDGEADFGLEAESLDIRWIARLLQLDEVLEGVVELELNVAGTDDEPVIDLALSTDGFRFGDYLVDQLEAEVAYADRTAEGDIAIWNDSLQVLTLAGEVPLDLSFNPVEERFPEEVIDLVVVSDELPLSLVMAPFPGYEEVVGTISGRVDVAGTSRSLAPQGQMTVEGGGAFLGGVRRTARGCGRYARLVPEWACGSGHGCPGRGDGRGWGHGVALDRAGSRIRLVHPPRRLSGDGPSATRQAASAVTFASKGRSRGRWFPVISFWTGEPCFTRNSRGQPMWPICSSSVPLGWRTYRQSTRRLSASGRSSRARILSSRTSGWKTRR